MNLVLIRYWILIPLLAAFSSATVMASSAGCVVVRSGRKPDCQATIRSANPIVFEPGKKNMPWTWVNKLEKHGDVVKWQAHYSDMVKPRDQKEHVYQVWDAGAFALNELAIVRKELSHSSPLPKRPIDAVLAELGYVKKLRASKDSQKLQLAQTRLSNALMALLKIKVDLEAGVGLKVWPAMALPVGSSFTCATPGVRARFTRMIYPTKWQPVSSAPSKSWFAAVPGKPRSSRAQILVPNEAVFYPGNHPVAAWYDVEYKHAKFTVSNAADVEMTSGIRKDVAIRTISETQIDLDLHLTSLMPIKNIQVELDLPNGWNGAVPQEFIDLNLVKDITYHITKPAGEKPGLKAVGAVYNMGDYGTGKRVITDHVLTLGQSAGVPGLKMVQAAGEHPEVDVDALSGHESRIMPSTGHMYFDISDNFWPGGETYVTLDCVNASTGAMAIEYYDASGKLCHTQSQVVDTGSQWRHYTFLLKDAKFDGDFPESADVKVTYNGGRLRVDEIRISKFRVPTSATAPASGPSS